MVCVPNPNAIETAVTAAPKTASSSTATGAAPAVSPSEETHEGMGSWVSSARVTLPSGEHGATKAAAKADAEAEATAALEADGGRLERIVLR